MWWGEAGVVAQGGGFLAERGASAGRAVVMMIGGLGQCMKVVGRPLSLMVDFDWDRFWEGGVWPVGHVIVGFATIRASRSRF